MAILIENREAETDSGFISGNCYNSLHRKGEVL